MSSQDPELESFLSLPGEQMQRRVLPMKGRASYPYHLLR